MTPIKFAGHNIIFAENQPEYIPLPAHRVPRVMEEFSNKPTSLEGRMTTCWQLTWRERIKLLLTGRLWLQTLTFYQALQPLLPLVDKPNLPDPHAYKRAKAHGRVLSHEEAEKVRQSMERK